jgi:MFS family permease
VSMAALVVLLIAQAMASMDASILVVAAPSIRSSLSASDAELQVIVATYTLAFGAGVVTGARLGDILGRRRAFLLGLSGFTMSSLVGGLAPDPVVLIVARGFQGAAAALMTPQVFSIIQLQFEGERRARAIGAYSMILAVGVAAGQIVGGLLVTADLVAAPWRPALLVNVAIGAPLLVVARRVLAPMPPSGAQPLDLTGAGLLAVAMLGFVVPLSFGRESGWPVWTWPCLALCALAGSLFVAHERRLDRRGGEPLLDLGLLRMLRVASGAIAVLLVMGCYAGFLVSVTLYLQESLGFTPLHAGATFAIYAGGFATASLTWTRARAATRARLPNCRSARHGHRAPRHWAERRRARLVCRAHDTTAVRRRNRPRVGVLAACRSARGRRPAGAGGSIERPDPHCKRRGPGGRRRRIRRGLSHRGNSKPRPRLALTTSVLSLVLALTAASAARATVARKSKPSLARV